MKRLLALLLLAIAPASAQTVTPSLSRPVLIFQSTAVTGNGADTTEDTLYTVAIPNQLAAVGDVIHVVTRGITAASTDSKAIRLKLVGQAVCSVTNATAGNTVFLIEAWILKTGTNAQSTICMNINNTNNTTTNVAATTTNDGAALTLVLTGQNNTTATANTIQVQQMLAWYIPGT